MISVANKLAHGSLLRIIDIASQSLVAFFLMPFIINSLGDRSYGIWAFVGSFVGYYGLLDLGLSSATQRYIAASIGSCNFEETNFYFNKSLFLFSVIGLFALIISFVSWIVIHFIYPDSDNLNLIGRLILIVGADIALGFPLRVFGGILSAHLRFDILSVIQICSLFLRTLLTIFVLILGYKVVALALVTILSGIPGRLLTVYFARKVFPSIRFELRVWNLNRTKNLFSYSIFSLIAQIADILRFQIDFFIIATFINFQAVTHYKIAHYVLSQNIILVSTIIGVLLPFFSRMEGAKDAKRLLETFFFGTKISICVSAFIAFGLIAWGKYFIIRWMGISFLDSYTCLVVLTIAALTDLAQNTSVFLLYGVSKHRFYAIMNWIEGFLNLALSLVLVKPFGILGVAFGTLIPMAFIRIVVQPVYVCKVLSITWFQYAYKVIKSFFNTLIALIIPFWISYKYASPSYLRLAIIGILSFVAYGATLWFIELTKSESIMVKKAIIPKSVARKLGINI